MRSESRSHNRRKPPPLRLRCAPAPPHAGGGALNGITRAPRRRQRQTPRHRLSHAKRARARRRIGRDRRCSAPSAGARPRAERGTRAAVPGHAAHGRMDHLATSVCRGYTGPGEGPPSQSTGPGVEMGDHSRSAPRPPTGPRLAGGAPLAPAALCPAAPCQSHVPWPCLTPPSPAGGLRCTPEGPGRAVSGAALHKRTIRTLHPPTLPPPFEAGAPPPRQVCARGAGQGGSSPRRRLKAGDPLRPGTRRVTWGNERGGPGVSPSLGHTSRA